MNREWTPDVVVYHAPCDDGFCAAWVARQRWPEVDVMPTTYGEPAPWLGSDLRGKNVLIVDFSFNPDVLTNLVVTSEGGGGAASVVVLDHHKTALDDLAQFVIVGADGLTPRVVAGWVIDSSVPVAAHFDMSKSGARLAWEFCFPGTPPPYIVELVEDRDLWRFKLPGSRMLSLWLKSYPYDFDVWTDLSERLTDRARFGDVLTEARSVERYHDRVVTELVTTAVRRKIMEYDGVLVVHTPHQFASDACELLLALHPLAPFAVAVEVVGERKKYQLRSDDNRVDVSEVARRLGGGGHRNAAGCTVPSWM